MKAAEISRLSEKEMTIFNSQKTVFYSFYLYCTASKSKSKEALESLTILGTTVVLLLLVKDFRSNP